VDDVTTIALHKPVRLGDQEFTEITLSEPTAGQIETALKEASQTTANIVLIALIAKIPPAAVRAMSLRDFNAAVAYLSGFTKGEAE
jgi:hypothetical protein